MGWRAVMGISEVEFGLESLNDLGRPGRGEHVTETERIAAVDAERNEADRQAHRGYDYNADEPSHAEFVQRQTAEYETAKAIGRHCEATGTDLVKYLGALWVSVKTMRDKRVTEA